MQFIENPNPKTKSLFGVKQRVEMSSSIDKGVKLVVQWITELFVGEKVGLFKCPLLMM